MVKVLIIEDNTIMSSLIKKNVKKLLPEIEKEIRIIDNKTEAENVLKDPTNNFKLIYWDYKLGDETTENFVDLFDPYADVFLISEYEKPMMDATNKKWHDRLKSLHILSANEKRDFLVINKGRLLEKDSLFYIHTENALRKHNYGLHTISLDYSFNKIDDKAFFLNDIVLISTANEKIVSKNITWDKSDRDNITQGKINHKLSIKDYFDFRKLIFTPHNIFISKSIYKTVEDILGTITYPFIKVNSSCIINIHHFKYEEHGNKYFLLYNFPKSFLSQKLQIEKAIENRYKNLDIHCMIKENAFPIILENAEYQSFRDELKLYGLSLTGE